MKLISCHIENFGKLSDKDFYFENPSGMNVFCEDNGWGKSTLATFIKVMFYGFDNEGRRNSLENERLHFKPWQGGVYGGRLTFGTDAKTYTILRTFGAKEKDDEFILQDADTGLAVSNFSKNIGEELFQIDSASFSRSVYISQNDCITVATDSINAKLGNLTDNTDDLNNYEAVAKKIADRLNAMSKTRKTGELYKQKEQITQLKQEIMKGKSLDASMEGILRLKNELHSSYEALKEEQGRLQGRQKAISEYKDILVKKKEYEYLCADEEKKLSLYKEKKALFVGRIPKEEEINRYIALEYQTSVLKRNLDSNKLSDEETDKLSLLEDKFGIGVPETETIREISDKVSDMQTLRWNIEKNMLTDDELGSLKHLEGLFTDGVPSDTEIDALSNAWSLRSERKNILSSKKAAVDMLKMTEAANGQSGDASDRKRAKAGKKRSGIVVAALSAAIALAALSAGAALVGLLLGVLTMPVAIVVLAADFIAVAIWAVVVRKSGKRADSETEDLPETPDGSADAPFMRLQKEIDEDEALIQKTETDIQQFFARYALPYGESGVISELYRLRENIRLYCRLMEKAGNVDIDGLNGRYDRLRDEVDGFLRGYGFGLYEAEDISDKIDPTMNYVNQLHKLETSAAEYTALKGRQESYTKSLEEYNKNMEALNSFTEEIKMDAGADLDLRSLLQLIKDTRTAYFSAKSEYEKAAEVKSGYETQNIGVLETIKNAQAVEGNASLAEIEERLSQISAEIEKYHTNMAAYERQLDELQEKRDEITDAENRLEELQESYGLNEKKLKTLQKTQKYLEQAKISLTAKYTMPIKEGFDKYFGILCGMESKNYQLDAKFGISVLEQGMLRDTAFLSNGLQDMVGICMRMALIDAMYKEEKPFVIFDDPFVNLDDKKTKGALRLLDVIAKEYQVVYFTCNESRQ